MARPSKKSRRRKAPRSRPNPRARTRAPRRPALRDDGSMASRSVAACRACRGAYRAQRGSRRLAYDKSARLSEAMIVAPTMMMEGDLHAMDRWNRADGRTRPLSWLRQAAVFASRGRLAAAAHGRARRELRVPNSAPTEAGGETFAGCKALKSHEMGMESADVKKAANQRSLMFVRCTGRLSVAHVTRARHGIQVNDHFICRISRRNWVFQLADFRRVLMLPLDLLARRRPSAKRRTTAMFLAPWPAR
jgi:hypothetical protein